MANRGEGEVRLPNGRTQDDAAIPADRDTVRSVLDVLEDYVFVTDPEGAILWVNAAVEEGLGYSLEDIAGCPILAVHPVGRQVEASRLLHEIMQGKTRVCTIPLESKDGRVVEVETKCARVRWYGECAWIGISRDMSGRNETEADLRASRQDLEDRVRDRTEALEAANRQLDERVDELETAREANRQHILFEQTLSTVAAAFVTHGFDEATNLALAAIGERSGASRAYLFLLRDSGATMDNTHEWCAPGVSAEKDNLQGVPSSLVPWWMEKLHRGEAIHILDVSELPPEASNEREILEPQGIKSLLVLPVKSGGSLSGFVGFDNVTGTGAWRETDLSILGAAADIIVNALSGHRAAVAQRHSEQTLRILWEHAPFAHFLHDIDGTLVNCNRAAEVLLGIPRAAAIGKSFLDSGDPRPRAGRAGPRGPLQPSRRRWRTACRVHGAREVRRREDHRSDQAHRGHRRSAPGAGYRQGDHRAESARVPRPTDPEARSHRHTRRRGGP